MLAPLNTPATVETEAISLSLQLALWERVLLRCQDPGPHVSRTHLRSSLISLSVKNPARSLTTIIQSFFKPSKLSAHPLLEAVNLLAYVIAQLDNIIFFQGSGSLELVGLRKLSN